MDGAPALAGIIGWPIAHSLSPLIHTIWAHRAGIDGYYIPLAIPPDYNSFAGAMDSLKTIGFAGVNITIPHKEHALRYAHERKGDASPTARSAGASNMLTLSNTRPYADNSDSAGFASAMRGSGAKKITSATVLGAGGAARGVVLALKDLGAERITIINRTGEKAQALAEAFGVDCAPWEARNAAAGADILVNATSLGMRGQPPLEIDLSALAKDAIIADIVYAPLETDLLRDAAARGHATVDGLSMLMHQAVPGFKAWFGGAAAVDGALRAELVRELERREKL